MLLLSNLELDENQNRTEYLVIALGLCMVLIFVKYHPFLFAANLQIYLVIINYLVVKVQEDVLVLETLKEL
jgi:hypothetical protein